jgi:ZIP family zinc transporter
VPEILALALLSASVTFFSTMGGGLTALRWPARREILMAFAGGLVLGAALLDLVPEAVRYAQDNDIGTDVPLIAMLVGYLTFHAVERWAHGADGHGHGHEAARAEVVGEDSTSLIGTAGALGFVVHSFFDGLAIGLAFGVGNEVGLLVAVAVIGHDFSDGLNTVTWLVTHRHSVRRQRGWLLAVSLMPLLGALVGTLLPVPEEVFPYVLGFFAGLFLYAASSHLLPAAGRLPAVRSLPATVLGAAVIFAVTRAGI